VGKFTTVAFAARDQAKAERIKATIKAMGRGEVDYILTDLASLSDVCRLAEEFRRRYSKLDVLINNAGTFAPSRQLTVDGFEASYQINYLSHFLLTQLLLEDLLSSDQGRIINLSSKVHSVGKFDPENLQSERKFSLLPTYASTKLLMLLFTIRIGKEAPWDEGHGECGSPRHRALTNDVACSGRVQTDLLLGASLLGFSPKGCRNVRISRVLSGREAYHWRILCRLKADRVQNRFQHRRDPAGTLANKQDASASSPAADCR
jgi:NAD(P)-dependent dehydrogenase (short-subunit alcohol dehydrogenase family)